MYALLEKWTCISVTVLLNARRQARLSALNADWTCGVFPNFPPPYLVGRLCAHHIGLIEILRSEQELSPI